VVERLLLSAALIGILWTAVLWAMKAS